MIYRPKRNLVWAAVCYLAVALFEVQSIFFSRAGANVLTDLMLAVPSVAVASLIWVRPKAVLSDTSIKVVNPFRTVKIAYSDIEELETKWSLTVVHGGKKTTIWVAPSGGKFRWMSDASQRWKPQRLPLSNTKFDGEQPISNSMLSDSGILAELIRRRIETMH
jgi:hypothetical protein